MLQDIKNSFFLKCIFSYFFLTLFLPYANAESFNCRLQQPIDVIKRVNLYDFNSNNVSSSIHNKKIHISSNALDPSNIFIYDVLKKGDEVFFKEEESNLFTITSDKKIYLTKGHRNLVPFVGYSSLDDKKFFGLAEIKSLKKSCLFSLDTKDLEVKNLLNVDLGPLTVIYVLCPPNRDSFCKLYIKHGSNFLRDDNDNVLALDVLAKSNYVDLANTKRIANSQDTPQGIYVVWGTMYSSQKDFGLVPRINIDGYGIGANNIMSTLSYPYNIFSPLIDNIVPVEFQKSYWINELPLAQSMGRVAFRMHANRQNKLDVTKYLLSPSGEKFYRTEGCINLGSNMEFLLNSLIRIDALDRNYSKRWINPEITWSISPKFGKVFLLLLDVNDIPDIK